MFLVFLSSFFFFLFSFTFRLLDFNASHRLSFAGDFPALRILAHVLVEGAP